MDVSSKSCIFAPVFYTMIYCIFIYVANIIKIMDKIIYKPKILVRNSKIPLIAKTAKCHVAVVYNALAFRTNTELARNIRAITKNLYGGLLVKRYPELLIEED